uniref:Alpha/beta hydrolase fold-3 domain-containing protein n=1 Tax=Knipowitschia caucasica TaxID=637954 RepID=A0AAV2LDW4_KNICA
MWTQSLPLHLWSGQSQKLLPVSGTSPTQRPGRHPHSIRDVTHAASGTSPTQRPGRHPHSVRDVTHTVSGTSPTQCLGRHPHSVRDVTHTASGTSPTQRLGRHPHSVRDVTHTASGTSPTQRVDSEELLSYSRADTGPVAMTTLPWVQKQPHSPWLLVHFHGGGFAAQTSKSHEVSDTPSRTSMTK